MDTIRIESAQSNFSAEARDATSPARQPRVTELRTLDDWELALASGGEDTPAWP
jgi:hypothetical protein